MAMVAGAPVLPQDLIVEILSRVPVKDLMRFRCISKTWNTLMFDSMLVKLHLQRSSRNIHILLTFVGDYPMNSDTDSDDESSDWIVVAPCSTRGLLDNPSNAIIDCSLRLKSDKIVFGACNGLVCFGYSIVWEEFEQYWIRFWNPSTRIMSEDSPRLCLYSCKYETKQRYHPNCGFGFDDSCDTYKAVVILLDNKSQEMEVRVYCMSDSCWRKTLTCTAFPILSGRTEGQFASGTLNWLALSMLGSDYQWETVAINQLVIFSYDLRNETCRYLFMPEGLSEVPTTEPWLGVLKGCICLSHHHRGTHFVVWVMREFGVEKSWIQLLNVSHEHLRIPYFPPCPVLMPLCMSENEDSLLLADYDGARLVLYNRRDNRIDRTDAYNDSTYRFFSYDYVPSLVLPY